MPLASAEGVLFASDVDAVAKRISALGRRYVVVDGFTGAGKSTFAESLAASLQLPWVELDSLLPPPEAVQDESYVERLDLQALGRLLESAQGAVIEGIQPWDALSGIVARTDATAVYLARCSNPAGSLIWHDGVRIEDGDGEGGNWLDRCELEYHRRVRPHQDADVLVVRISE